MSTVTEYQFLERDPKSSYKQLSIKGRRIRARTLYGCYMSEEEPRTIEQIAEDFDLPVAAVKEAVAYCETDPPEIREDFAREEAIMEATGMNDPNYKYHGKPKVLTAQEMARLNRCICTLTTILFHLQSQGLLEPAQLGCHCGRPSSWDSGRPQRQRL